MKKMLIIAGPGVDAAVIATLTDAYGQTVDILTTDDMAPAATAPRPPEVVVLLDRPAPHKKVVLDLPPPRDLSPWERLRQHPTRTGKASKGGKRHWHRPR